MRVMLTVSLGLTLLFEEGFALLWGLRGRRELLLVLLANLLTNPAVVLMHFTAVWLWGWGDAPVTLVLESTAVLAEWRCYRSCSEHIRQPFRFALLANLFSYGAGELLKWLI